jgi:hypothetical protein
MRVKRDLLSVEFEHSAGLADAIECHRECQRNGLVCEPGVCPVCYKIRER